MGREREREMHGGVDEIVAVERMEEREAMIFLKAIGEAWRNM